MASVSKLDTKVTSRTRSSRGAERRTCRLARPEGHVIGCSRSGGEGSRSSGIAIRRIRSAHLSLCSSIERTRGAKLRARATPMSGLAGRSCARERLRPPVGGNSTDSVAAIASMNSTTVGRPWVVRKFRARRRGRGARRASARAARALARAPRRRRDTPPARARPCAGRGGDPSRSPTGLGRP